MKISILIITYNHEKYIRQALESVLAQRDCPEFEIILSDDCSADNTVLLAAEILSAAKNVIIHKNEKNLGITANYQQAFARCNGQYIFVLEGDDYWTDTLKLKTVGEFLDNHPTYVLCAHTHFSKLEATDNFVPPANNKEEPYTTFTSEELILDHGIVSNFSSCCYRKSALEKISPKTYTVPTYEWMINISIGQFGMLARINQPMSVYRISANGAWSNKSQEQQVDAMVGIIDTYDELLAHKYAAAFGEKKRVLLNDLVILRGVPSKPQRTAFTSALSSLSRWFSKSTAKN